MMCIASSEQIAEVLSKAPPHLRPLFLAVRDFDCAHAIILPDAGCFRLPADKPVIACVGDDLEVSRGPLAFHAKSMKRLIRSCASAVVVSSGPEVAPYAAAASTAVMLRRNSLLIETRIEHEIPWISFVRKAAPDVRMLVSTVKGGTA